MSYVSFMQDLQTAMRGHTHTTQHIYPWAEKFSETEHSTLDTDHTYL